MVPEAKLRVHSGREMPCSIYVTHPRSSFTTAALEKATSILQNDFTIVKMVKLYNSIKGRLKPLSMPNQKRKRKAISKLDK